MNDSVKNQKAKVQIDEPTGLMGTQVALNIAQGSIDAMNEIGISKSQLKDWDQGEIRKKSKEVTKRFLGFMTHDLWFADKIKIATFYLNCFGKEWAPNFSEANFPEVKDLAIKRPEFIFPKMTMQEAFDAYADYFGKDKVWKAWDDISKAIDPETVQPRPGQNYVMLHVGGDEPDLLNKSYDDGISENIIFMTPLEGIISAFRYRFETGKMYDVKGLTRLSVLDQNGYTMSMYGGPDNWFRMDSFSRNDRHPQSGLRRVSF